MCGASRAHRVAGYLRSLGAVRRQMAPLKRWEEVILSLCLLPFLLTGILLRAMVYSWFYESLTGDSRQWLTLLGPILCTAGTYIGALIGFGVVVFFLTWFAPDFALRALAGPDRTTLTQRMFGPPLLVVRRVAERLVPGRRT